MNQSGDAAEQILRISFDGMEHVLRLAGAGAKNIAALIMAAIKKEDTDDKLKLKGKERLSNMLKSGKELKIFSMKNSDLEQFSKEAKKYGVVYCALKDKGKSPTSVVDVMAKADDASKISRIMDKLQIATIDRASIEAHKETAADKSAAQEAPEAPDVNDTDKLLDMLIDEEGKARTDAPDIATQEMANPTPAGTETRNPQSVSRSKTQSESAGATPIIDKPSVREFLRERAAQNRKSETPAIKRNQPDVAKTGNKVQQHRQPQPRRSKPKKVKER